MLFEKCDSSLEKFLMRPDSEVFEGSHSYYHALYGLSGALNELHNFDSTELHIEKVGCHYDLKPNNILVKVDDEKFILADFGEAAFKDAFEDSRQTAGNVGGDYIAPEWENLDQGFTKLSPGRSSDVWSFGCILLEVVVRIYEGVDGLKEFRKLRKTRQSYHTHCRFHANGQLNIAVRDKMNALSSEHTTEPMPALISLVQAMLFIDPQQRKDIQWITSRLGKIANPTGDEYSASQVCAKNDTAHFHRRSLASISSLHSPLAPVKNQSDEVTLASGPSAEIQASTEPDVLTRGTPVDGYTLTMMRRIAASSNTQPSSFGLPGDSMVPMDNKNHLTPTTQSDTKDSSPILSIWGEKETRHLVSKTEHDTEDSSFAMSASKPSDTRMYGRIDLLPTLQSGNLLRRIFTQDIEIYEQRLLKSLWKSQKLTRWIRRSTPGILQITTVLDNNMQNVLRRVSAELVSNLQMKLRPHSQLWPLYHFCKAPLPLLIEPVLWLVFDILNQLRAASGRHSIVVSSDDPGSQLEACLDEIKDIVESTVGIKFVCILDNVQMHLHHDRLEHMTKVVKCLQALIKDGDQAGGIFKLLLTVAGREPGRKLPYRNVSDVFIFDDSVSVELDDDCQNMYESLSKLFSKYEPVWG
jgi:serine/threonine protein kinase